MIEKLLVFVNLFRFVPHLILFATDGNRRIIEEDIAAYRKEYGIKGSVVYVFVHLLTHNTSFRSLFYYRIRNKKWLCQWLGKGATELRIPASARIGSGLLLFHAYGTIFSSKCTVGEGCRIVHNVTIGEKNGEAPTIGNNVEILPNAVISGDIKVGNNCVIGPGAVVFKNVPDNCVVVGNPAYILKRDGIVVNQKL